MAELAILASSDALADAAFLRLALLSRTTISSAVRRCLMWSYTALSAQAKSRVRELRSELAPMYDE